MIKLLYIILLVGLLIVERYISEKQEIRGLLLAVGLMILGVVLLPQLLYAGIITAGVNVGRLCITELRMMRLTSLQDKYPTAYDSYK